VNLLRRSRLRRAPRPGSAGRRVPHRSDSPPRSLGEPGTGRRVAQSRRFSGERRRILYAFEDRERARPATSGSFGRAHRSREQCESDDHAPSAREHAPPMRSIAPRPTTDQAPHDRTGIVTNSSAPITTTPPPPGWRRSGSQVSLRDQRGGRFAQRRNARTRRRARRSRHLGTNRSTARQHRTAVRRAQ